VSLSIFANSKEGLAAAAVVELAIAEDLEAATDATTLSTGARVAAREAERVEVD
jgi:ribose 5-phosphate isomerase RpiB